MRPIAYLLVSFFSVNAFADKRVYEIKGMTCEGCVASIEAKVCKLPGVKACNVEIGKVTLDGAKIDDDAVKTAVSAAGDYKVSSVEHADAGSEAAQKPNPGPTLKTPAKKGK